MWISMIYPVGFWRKLKRVQLLMLPKQIDLAILFPWVGNPRLFWLKLKRVQLLMLPKQIDLAILFPWVGNPRLLLVNPYRGFVQQS